MKKVWEHRSTRPRHTTPLHKAKRLYQTYLSMVVFCSQCSYHEKLSEKTTVTASDNSDINY